MVLYFTVFENPGGEHGPLLSPATDADGTSILYHSQGFRIGVRSR